MKTLLAASLALALSGGTVSAQNGSVPEITRMIARIEDWKGQGPVLGRAEAARRLEEAHKLLEEIADMLTHMRR